MMSLILWKTGTPLLPSCESGQVNMLGFYSHPWTPSKPSKGLWDPGLRGPATPDLVHFLMPGSAWPSNQFDISSYACCCPGVPIHSCRLTPSLRWAWVFHSLLPTCHGEDLILQPTDLHQQGSILCILMWTQVPRSSRCFPYLTVSHSALVLKVCWTVEPWGKFLKNINAQVLPQTNKIRISGVRARH